MFPYNFLSFEILLPFFLVLAIVYGALEVSRVFSNRAVKGIIAVVFAFFAVMNYEVVMFINYILPYAAGFFVIIFLIWIILKPLKIGGGIDPLMFIVILALVLILLARLNSLGYTEYTFLSDPNFLWLIGIVVVLVLIWKAYKIGKFGK